MEINTKDLIGDALDWAVTKCEGLNAEALIELAKRVPGKSCGYFLKKYSTDWYQCGLIIDRKRLNLRASGAGDWVASTHDVPHPNRILQYGPTPLIATMRCYVASELGDTVDVPEELLK